MKIVHLSTNDIGGAAQAAKRLHAGLIQAGEHSTFISKYTHHEKIQNHISYVGHHSLKHFLEFGLEHYILTKRFPPRHGYSKDTVLFTSPHSLFHPETLQSVLEADIVHLHWTSHFLDYQTFFKRIDKPVVWTLHDMYPFTGGCHYSGDCMQFVRDCKECPQIKQTAQPQLAVQYFEYKRKALTGINNLSIVAPSQWLFNLSRQSVLFKDRPHYHVGYGLDTTVFKLLDKHQCRVKWKIPEGKINLLFVAHSLKMSWKGFDILIEALKGVPKNRIHLTIIGKNIPDLSVKDLSTSALGYISVEYKMAELYNAADLYITPSLRDNLPNTIMESVSCGTPVLAFEIGGIREMIQAGENGLFAHTQTVQGITDGIMRFLNHPTVFDSSAIHLKAREKYDLSKYVSQYLELYQSMVR